MNIIIPMAGMGKRLRPHTLTVPKPLIPIAGKPIVQRLVEDIAAVCGEPIDEIAFVVGAFGGEIEQRLLTIAASVGARGHICYQHEALGTAHAVLCAADTLQGNVVVAYADTLFRADFRLATEQEAIVWVQQVAEPSAFGVVKLDGANEITGFVEKPKEFISNLAIIGIYYFRDGAYLKQELQFLIDNDIQVKGEYQLTDALENMRRKGTKFVPGQVQEWLDCGNKEATVQTNQRYLEFIRETDLVAATAVLINSVVVPPVFIGENVCIENTVLGPHVSVGNGTRISGSVVRNCIVQENSVIENVNLADSMLGSFARIEGRPLDLSVGDYNVVRV
ncbi:MAG: NTP transferase domain-containing protein [Cytophagaceae bacterium]|nr:NTP transferase domain-containing protein [Cytophagaceae bacterium]